MGAHNQSENRKLYHNFHELSISHVERPLNCNETIESDHLALKENLATG